MTVVLVLVSEMQCCRYLVPSHSSLGKPGFQEAKFQEDGYPDK